MKAIVLADGDVPTRSELDAAWPGWADDAGLVVAADGGARHVAGLGLGVDAWVGDGDSLDATSRAALVAARVELRPVPAAKDESDTELAVLEALARGADHLVVLGALGGPRVDHTLANIGLLAMPELAGRSAQLLDAGARIRLISAPQADGSAVHLALTGRVGDLVSLLPYGAGVEGVRTHGLAYPLADEPLPPGPARGLSNVRDATDAWVMVRAGRLLVIETPATLAR